MIHIYTFLIAPLGPDASCEAPRVMPHCTSGWSLRWFHHRLVGIVGTLCTHYTAEATEAWSVSSLPNTAIQPTPPGFEPWTLALRAAALYQLRQSNRTAPIEPDCANQTGLHLIY